MKVRYFAQSTYGMIFLLVDNVIGTFWKYDQSAIVNDLRTTCEDTYVAQLE
jgi:hypothetical protein